MNISAPVDPGSCTFKGLFKITEDWLEGSDFPVWTDLVGPARRQFALVGELQSPECSVSLRVPRLSSLPLHDTASQARLYVGAALVSSALLVIGVIRQMTYTSTTAVRSIFYICAAFF